METGVMRVQLSNGRRVFVDVEGSGLVPDGASLRPRPTVVLIHGSEVDHGFFKPWVTPLASVAQLVYVDLVGHGRSDEGEPSDWSIPAWADSIAEVCDTLGLERPVLLGSSMGGRIALVTAMRHPDLVGVLIIVNAVVDGDPERRIEIFRALGGDEAAAAAHLDMAKRSEESKEAYMRLCMPLTVRRPYSPEELARLRPVSAEVMGALVRIGKEPSGVLDQLSAIECPTLVMTGEFDPAAPPGDAADLVAAIGPNATLSIIEDAGHGVYRDQPEAFIGAVKAFLEDQTLRAQNAIRSEQR